MNSDNKLRLAFFNATMKPGQDGVTRVLFKLIEWLNEHGIDSFFISSDIPEKQEQTTLFHKVPSLPLPLYNEYKFTIPSYKTFEKQLLEFNPDVIHINSPCPLGLAALNFGKKYSIPVVATYHTHFPSYAKYYNIKQFEFIGWSYLRKLYNRCDKVFVPSISIMDELRARGFKSTEHLPHGIDLNLFRPEFKSTEWKKAQNIEGKKVLLYVGRLVWEKDLKTLSEIYSIITNLRDDIIFVLAGEGPIRKDLERIMPEALFLGYKSGKELSTIFASSDLFIFPSTTETFGNVVLESMASGLVPICSNEGGASGSIKHNVNGLICKAKDSLDFSKKIISLLNNENELNILSSNCIEYASKQSWDNIFTVQYQHYLQIMNEQITNQLTIPVESEVDFAG